MVEYPDYGEGCLLQCDCSAECYREDSGHHEYRSGWTRSGDFGERVCMGSPSGDTEARWPSLLPLTLSSFSHRLKRRSSSSTSPPPKKKKKKKSGHRRSR